MSGRLLTRDQVAAELGLADNPRAVYSLPIPRSPLSPRRTRWAADDVEAYRRQHCFARPPKTAVLDAGQILASPVAAPTKPGIYFLVLRGEIVYVGQSINPLCRLGQHAAERQFDSFVVLPCPVKELATIEGAYILALRPRYNKNGL